MNYFEDWQIEDLKAAMFQLGRGLWFSREMILDDESWLAVISVNNGLPGDVSISEERILVLP